MSNPILIVSDDQQDAAMLQKLLRKNGVLNPIQALTNGLTAIDYFYGLEPYPNRRLYPLPGLLFVNISMPGNTGYDLLEWLHSRNELPKPRIAIFRQFFDSRDVIRCRDLGADAFLTSERLEQQFPFLYNLYLDLWEFAAPLLAPGPSLSATA